MKKLQFLIMTAAMFTFVACGGGQKEHAEDGSHDDHAEAAEHDHPAEEGNSGVATMMEAPEGARVFFKNLEDGAVVASPIKVEMGVEGITIKPAGELVEGTGHHHIIINEGPTPFGTVVGADETHIHFGKGQEETELVLEPGEYSLTLQFADGFHRSYGDKMSTTIKITVE